MDRAIFEKKDRELADLYNEYLADCAQHETQIAFNHQSMAKIRMNREDLKRQYDDENVC